MTSRTKLMILHAVFRRLEDKALSTPGVSLRWYRYLDMIKREEKEHRRAIHSLGRNGLSAPKAVELFAVQSIFKWQLGMSGHKVEPRAKDIFDFKLSYFGSFALAAAMPDAKDICTFSERITVMDLDYAKLNEADD